MNPNDCLRAYEAASQNKDLEAVLSLVDKDAVYWFSNEGCYSGKLKIEEAIRNNFQTIEDETYEIYDLQWIAQSETLSVCLYGYRWSGVIHGQQAAGTGRGTAVLTKKETGWVILHEHLSRGPCQS
ncbi:MAG: nuclear transport factor 2 family protein [Verrucomicrobiota bacterium]